MPHKPLIAALALLAGGDVASAQTEARPLLTGKAALGDWRTDAPGVRRKITAADLPAPHATPSAFASPSVVQRPHGAELEVPDGFKVEAWATGLRSPRVVRTAPNGDVFVAETYAGRITVLRQGGGGAPQRFDFAEGLRQPFGIGFWPPGPNPQFVYVALLNQVVRFPYRNGDGKAQGPAETIVARLAPTTGGHTTRDLVFSNDGKRMFVSVGSASNVAESMARKSPAEARAWDREHGSGAAWGNEENRADVLVFTPQGGPGRVYASGIRNCSGINVEPHTGDVWCVTNERDGLGDDLVPDYATRVREGATYGWPWWYIGDHEDPRLKGERPDLRGHVTVPDVLFESHSAPLGLSFYPDRIEGASAFPNDYRGDAYVAMHGSWNRSRRTGYKVVRVRLKNGVPTGEYDDFLTGFVVDDGSVWGRLVDTAVARDGALLVTDDAAGTIWRVSRK